MTDKQPDAGTPPNVLDVISEEMTPEQKLNALISIVAAIAKDLHNVKGGMAANTSITLGVAEGQDQLRKAINQIDFPLLAESLTAIASMKGGLKVLGWLERPAKWLVAVAAAFGVFKWGWPR